MKNGFVWGGVAVGILVLAVARISQSSPTDLPNPSTNLAPTTPQDNVQMRSLPAGEPAEAEPKEEKEPEEDRLVQLQNQVMSLVANADFVELLESLKPDENTADASLNRVAVRRWADLDGAAAASWVEQLEPGMARTEGLRQVAIGWANADLTSATEWARTFPEGPERNTVLLDVAYEAARSLPKDALALAELLPAGAERDELLVHAAGQWAAVEPDPAMQWAQSVASPVLQSNLVTAVATTLADRNGGAAAQLIAERLAAGEEQDRAAVSIVQRWAVEDPSSTASWVALFPDTSARAEAVKNLVEIWHGQDSEEAARWLNELPEGPLRETALSAYQEVLAEAHPGAAIAEHP